LETGDQGEKLKGVDAITGGRWLKGDRLEGRAALLTLLRGVRVKKDT